MKLSQVEEALNNNLVETSFIASVKLDGHIVKSFDGDDEITDFILKLDDHVETQLWITAVGGKLVIRMSQLEPPKPTEMVRRNYLDSNLSVKE